MTDLAVRAPMRVAQRRQEPRSVVRKAFVRFVVWTVVALLAVAGGAALLSRHLAEREALREAERIGRMLATEGVAPLVTADVRRGDQAALDELDRVIRLRIADGSISRLKLWDVDGRVIYSDDRRLIGQRFELAAEDRETLAEQRTTVELSDLGRDENVYERDAGQLLEVYVGARAADGQPVLVESYLPAESIQESTESLSDALIPVAVIALLLFQAAILPFALSLARRVDRAQQERARLLSHAVRASDLERQRIAQDLHDNVIQDLAGLSYGLSALSGRLTAQEAAGGPRHEATRDVVDRATRVLQQDVAALRGMLTDIYPPDVAQGLVQAVAKVVDTHQGEGLVISLVAAPEVEHRVPEQTAALASRVVREALRNVVKHAMADRAEVWLERPGPDLLRVVVDDDGVGYDPATALGPDDGHFGLELLRDTIRDTGGRFVIARRPDGGTRVEVLLAWHP